MFEISFLEIMLLILFSIDNIKVTISRVFEFFFTSFLDGQRKRSVFLRKRNSWVMINYIVVYIVAIVVFLS